MSGVWVGENTGMAAEANLGPELRRDEEFEGLVPELSTAEYLALEATIAVEGLEDPLVVWRPPGEEGEPPVLVDGHARYGICRDNHVPYRATEKEFSSREEAATWIIIKHLRRKNLTSVDRCEVAISLEPRLRAAAKERKSRGGSVGGRGGKGKTKDPPDPAGPSASSGSVLDALLAAHGIEKGDVRDQAAKIADIGRTSVNAYKRIKEAAEDASDPKLAKKASELLEGLSGSEPSLKVDGARHMLDAEIGRLADERKRAARERHLRRTFGDSPEGGQGGSPAPEDETPEDNAPESGIPEEKTPEDEMLEEGAPEDDERNESGNEIDGIPSRVPRNLALWTPERPVWSCGEFQSFLEQDEYELPQGEVGLLLTDPPYGSDFGRTFTDTQEEADERLIDMFRIFEECLAPDAHVVFFCGERHEQRMRELMKTHAKYLVEQRRLGWVQSKPENPTEADGRISGSPYSFAPALEIAIHATRGRPPRITPRDTPNAYVAPRIPAETRGHETEKPAAILRHIIEAATVPGDIVADPFGGVASTLEATIRSGRRGWSCEKSSIHHIKGTKRINGVLDELRESRRPSDEGFELLLQPARSGIMPEAEPAPLTSLPDDPLGGVPAVIWGFGDPPEEVLAASRASS